MVGSLCHMSCSSDVRFWIGGNNSKGRDAYYCNIKILAADVWSEKKGEKLFTKPKSDLLYIHKYTVAYLVFDSAIHGKSHFSTEQDINF